MKISIDGTLYEEPQADDVGLTNIEARLLKREYGFVPLIGGLDLRDPDHAGAFAYLVLRKAMPRASSAELIAQIETVRLLERVNDDGSPITEEQAAALEEEQRNPTRPPSSGGNGSGTARVEAGG